MSFIVVKYGKDQEKLFNTNCKVINLLHCIRESCGCKDCDIDLAEEASGILQFLPTNLHEHSNSIMVVPKSTYVLVKIQKTEDGTTEYLPMLDVNRSNFLVKPRSTRAKTETARKRGDKKSKEDTTPAQPTLAPAPAAAAASPAPSLDISSLAVPAGGTSSSLTPTAAATTPNTLTPTPAGAAAGGGGAGGLGASGGTSNPASASSTPNTGQKRSPTQQQKSIGGLAGVVKKTLFPKIDGSGSGDVTSSSSTPITPVSVTTGEEAIVTTSPIITPAAKKRTPKKSGSILEPIN